MAEETLHVPLNSWTVDRTVLQVLNTYSKYEYTALVTLICQGEWDPPLTDPNDLDSEAGEEQVR